MIILTLKNGITWSGKVNKRLDTPWLYPLMDCHLQAIGHSVFSGLYPYMSPIHYHIGIKSHKTQQLRQGHTRDCEFPGFQNDAFSMYLAKRGRQRERERGWMRGVSWQASKTLGRKASSDLRVNACQSCHCCFDSFSIISLRNLGEWILFAYIKCNF